MLKSTHQPVLRAEPAPLPSPWTEHKAPSGHSYYYNSETKQSTYTRPAASPSPSPAPEPQQQPEPQQPAPLRYDPTSATGWRPGPSPAFAAQYGTLPETGRQSLPSQTQQFKKHRFERAEDRPKSKHPIPGHAPWLLIKTRLRRRFVHNAESGESFWKVPKELVGGLVEFDRSERERKERAENGAREPDMRRVPGDIEPQDVQRRSQPGETEVGDAQMKDGQGAAEGSGSDEYEEVEVTDSEYESEGHPPKRQKMSPREDREEREATSDDEELQYMIEEEDEDMDESQQPPPNQGTELGEDDMAAQLAAMGADYDLDPTEYYAEDDQYDGEAESEAYGLTQEEAEASFKDMLDDLGINPYSTWDSLIEESNPISQVLISDDRYTLLTSRRARQAVFAAWSTLKIAALKEAREKHVKLNPKIPYLRFLSEHANPKLFWAEFKRKYKREPEMKEGRLGDKEREKLYREYIKRTTTISEGSRREDLEILMRQTPPGPSWNRSSSAAVDGLMSEALLADIRYATVPARFREELVAEFTRKLPAADEVADQEGTKEEGRRKRQERERRDEAMRRRGQEVEARRRDQEKELRSADRRLRDEERELERAKHVGNTGLRGQFQT